MPKSDYEEAIRKMSLIVQHELPPGTEVVFIFHREGPIEHEPQGCEVLGAGNTSVAKSYGIIAEYIESSSAQCGEPRLEIRRGIGQMVQAATKWALEDLSEQIGRTPIRGGNGDHVH